MAQYNKVKDSGSREDMATGSRRDTQEGKPRADLINPLVNRRLGMHFSNGADKYGEHNFELGQKTSRYLASLSRHLDDYKEGLTDEDHLAAIMWNVHCIIMNQEFVERGIYDPEMDDSTDYTTKEGFDATVGKRAREFNDELRKAEDTISDVTYEDCLEHKKDGKVGEQPVPVGTKPIGVYRGDWYPRKDYMAQVRARADKLCGKECKGNSIDEQVTEREAELARLHTMYVDEEGTCTCPLEPCLAKLSLDILKDI